MVKKKLPSVSVSDGPPCPEQTELGAKKEKGSAKGPKRARDPTSCGWDQTAGEKHGFPKGERVLEDSSRALESQGWKGATVKNG